MMEIYIYLFILWFLLRIPGFIYAFMRKRTSAFISIIWCYSAICLLLYFVRCILIRYGTYFFLLVMYIIWTTKNILENEGSTIVNKRTFLRIFKIYWKGYGAKCAVVKRYSKGNMKYSIVVAASKSQYSSEREILNERKEPHVCEQNAHHEIKWGQVSERLCWDSDTTCSLLGLWGCGVADVPILLQVHLQADKRLETTRPHTHRREALHL